MLVEISALWNSSKCACFPLGIGTNCLHSQHLKNFSSGCLEDMCRFMAYCVSCMELHTKHLKFFFLGLVQWCIWLLDSLCSFISHGLIIFAKKWIIVLLFNAVVKNIKNSVHSGLTKKSINFHHITDLRSICTSHHLCSTKRYFQFLQYFHNKTFKNITIVDIKEYL